MKFQLRSWIRSRRALVLVVVFAFSGASAPLLAAHVAEIIASLGDETMVVEIADPTWQSLLTAYWDNASQLGLLVTAYVAGAAVGLGSDPSLRIHYLTRTTRRGQIAVPRLLVAAMVAGVAATVGFLIALYVTWAVTDGMQLGAVAGAGAVHVAAVVLVTVVAGSLGLITGSPFVSTLLTAGMVYGGSLAQALPTVGEWSPTLLLTPGALLDGQDPGDLLRPVLVLGAVTVLCLTFATLPSTRPGLASISRPLGAPPTREAPVTPTAGRPRPRSHQLVTTGDRG